MKLTIFLFLVMVQVMLSDNLHAEDKYDFLRKGEAPNVDSVLVPEYAEQVPHSGLAAIAKLYEGVGFPEEKIEERTRFLKAFFLTYSNQYARASINALKSKNVSSTFLADVDDMRKWYVDLMGQPSEKIKEVAEREGDRLLSVMMSKKGTRKEKHLQIIKDAIAEFGDVTEDWKKEAYFKIIFRYAQQGQHKAILEMAKTYSPNGTLPANPSKHYFWLRHAAWIGADVEGDLKEIKSSLDKKTISKMDQLFFTNKYPDAMEKPKGHWKVIGGPNRRWVPPYLWEDKVATTTDKD
ncbi:hypothetical protein [Terasakiella sp.]|uniref:hypothetical protein n=1 Tax=Terasakiella sp. TaxID=2034861 RepID=UPI003AA87808